MRDHIDSDFFKLPLPRAIGHRGSAGTHPENTLESFRAAAAMGAEYIELDVHMTRDGEIVVSHDDHLARTCGLERTIREMTYAEVAAADAGRMLTLDAASFPFRDKGIKVVETLAPDRYREAHLPGALNIPPEKVRELAPQLLPNKDAEIVTYCANSH